jgi:hypothetical protein
MLRTFPLFLCALFIHLSIAPKAHALPNFSELKQAGMISVLDPTNGNCTNDGATDCTKAIQKAIDTGYTNRLAVFFPPGDYLISNTLVALHNRKESRRNAIQLIGSTNGAKPRIILKANSFTDNNASNDDQMTNKKAMIHFWACLYGEDRQSDCEPEYTQQKSLANTTHGNPAMMMAGVVRNLEFVIKSGNPDAIGIRFAGAQDNIISNVKITNESNSYAGIYSIIGTNAVFQDVEIVGGKIGIHGGDSRWPSINNIKLYNQSLAAIGGLKSAGPLSINGLEIVKEEAPVISDAINQFSYYSDSYSGGAYALSDAVITISKNTNKPVFENTGNRQLTLQNVYIKNGSVITTSNSGAVAGNATGWTRVNVFAKVVPGYSTNNGLRLENGGSKTTDLISVQTQNVPAPNTGQLLANHAVDRNILPSPDVIIDRSKANDPKYIYTPHKNLSPIVSGGYTTTSPDHTQALQQIINQTGAEFILIPKGALLISNTIDLKENTKLMGVSNTLTEIITHPKWTTTTATPVLRTPNSTTATTIMAFFKPQYTTDPTKATFNLIHWRSGKNSLAYNLMTRPLFTPAGKLDQFKPRSEYLITDNGGGRFFGIATGAVGESSKWYAGFRGVNIRNTVQPLTIYGLDPEDAGMTCTTSGTCKADDSAMQVEIRDAKNVAIRGFKCEDYNSVNAYNSTNIFANGIGGCTDWLYSNVNQALILNMASKFNSGTTNRAEGNKILFEEMVNNSIVASLRQKTAMAAYQRGNLPDFSVWDRNASTIPTTQPEPTITTSPISPTTQPQTWDLNNSGKVDIFDFSYLVKGFGSLYSLADIASFRQAM